MAILQCGVDTITVPVPASSTVELVLVSDLGGKYDQLSNKARYSSDVMRRALACCDSDCDSNLVCDCPADQGRFEVELKRAPTIAKRRSLMTIVPFDQWSDWYRKGLDHINFQS